MKVKIKATSRDLVALPPRDLLATGICVRVSDFHLRTGTPTTPGNILVCKRLNVGPDMPIEIYDYGSEEQDYRGTDLFQQIPSLPANSRALLKSHRAVGHGSLLRRGSNRDSSRRKRQDIYTGTTTKTPRKFRGFESGRPTGGL